MVGEWASMRLGRFIELKRGYDLPRRHRQPGSVPVVSSSGVTGTHNEAKVRGPGVVTGRYGTIGEVHFMKGDFWPLNTTLYVRDFKSADPLFVSYFLRTLDFAPYSDKAAVPGVNRNHLHEAEVVVPVAVRDQQAIAAVLGALDDKIELNRRMNETLDEVARAAFEHWFVHRGFVGSPGGPGVALRDVATISKGRSYRSAELAPSSTALVTLKSFARGGGYRECGLKPYLGRYRDDQVVEPGEVVLALTDVTQAADVVGRPAIVPAGAGYETLVASVDVGVIRPRDHRLPRPFLYYLLKTQGCVDHAIARTTGTTVLHLKPEAMLDYQFGMPPASEIERFNELAQACISRASIGQQESTVLGELRDTFLPRLISGELRLPEAERLVSEVT